jgi:hypothetical protein
MLMICSMFVADDAAALPTFAVNISDSSIPIYFHCKQPVGNHCGNGNDSVWVVEEKLIILINRNGIRYQRSGDL